MKSIFCRLFAASLLIAAISCNNEKTEATKTEVKTSTPVKTTTETKKTEVTVGPGSAEVKTKDVNVKLNTKDTTKK